MFYPAGAVAGFGNVPHSGLRPGCPSQTVRPTMICTDGPNLARTSLAIASLPGVRFKTRSPCPHWPMPEKRLPTRSVTSFSMLGTWAGGTAGMVVLLVQAGGGAAGMDRRGLVLSQVLDQTRT
jgi:hypothetical protein